MKVIDRKLRNGNENEDKNVGAKSFDAAVPQIWLQTKLAFQTINYKKMLIKTKTQ